MCVRVCVIVIATSVKHNNLRTPVVRHFTVPNIVSKDETCLRMLPVEYNEE